MVFHNESNVNYHFIIKALAKEFKGEFNCLGENILKYILKNTKPFQFQNLKKLKELINIEKKLQKPDLTKYNLLIAQDLWQAHYQLLLIILLKESIRLNVNIDIKCEKYGIEYKDCECRFEHRNV